MPLLTAAQIRSEIAKRRSFEDMEVAELGGGVRLYALSAGDLVHLNHQKAKATAEGRNPNEVAFEYVARSWGTETGELLFPVEEGIAVAKTLSDTAYAEILTRVIALNGVGANEDVGKN